MCHLSAVSGHANIWSSCAVVHPAGNPLRTLSLRGCHEVDDWALARLHVFQDTLEELDISCCPHITIGGLAALRNLK